MKSKRFTGMLVSVSLLAVILAACAPVVAVPPTEPTAAPTEEATVDPQDQPIPVDGPLVVIYRHGGLCVTGGECQWTMTINNDGTYTVSGGTLEPKEGTLTAAQVAEITRLIGETDFDKILNTPFTGTCPTASDGQETVYTFYHTGGALELANCSVTVDPEAPLFALLDQIFADATAAE